MGCGDKRILEYACTEGFILVSTDRDFDRLAPAMKDANVVILCACNYPTETAADALRRNAIRIAELVLSQEHVILLEK